MLSEQITVTTDITTIKSLLETARSVAAGTFKPTKCVGIMLRCDPSETETITLSDENSSTGATILDAPNSLVVASFQQFDIGKVSLSCSSGTIVVDLIIEQKLM